MSYNTLKNTWSLNELISHCVQEEERLQQEDKESSHMASSYQHKRKREATAVTPSLQKKIKKQNEVLTCFFCKKTGHIRKDCAKYVAWRVNKGMILAFVYSKVNLCFAPMDTWWVDSAVTTHISVIMQGCLWSLPPSGAERFIYVADDNKVAMEVVGTFKLYFSTRLFLDLFETFYVPSFRRNLVFVSRLDKSGYHSSFENNNVSLLQNSNVICSDFLTDNLYKLDLNLCNEILQTKSRGTKQKLNENSVSLWHKYLGHISKQRIQRLVVDGILKPLDLKDFQVCIECIKGKRTNERKLSAERAKDVLELIHIDICGLFPTASWNGQCFITFIDG